MYSTPCSSLLFPSSPSSPLDLDLHHGRATFFSFPTHRHTNPVLVVGQCFVVAVMTPSACTLLIMSFKAFSLTHSLFVSIPVLKEVAALHTLREESCRAMVVLFFSFLALTIRYLQGNQDETTLNGCLSHMVCVPCPLCACLCEYARMRQLSTCRLAAS